MMAVNPRPFQRTPDNERRALQRRLDAQLSKLKDFAKDRAEAEEIVEKWNEGASKHLEQLCDIAFPLDAPKDPTSAAVMLGRIQGYLEPLRRAKDTLGLTEQMQLTADKTREQIDELGEEDLDDTFDG